MPSPVGHLLGGLSVGVALGSRLPTLDSRARALTIACALAAVAPDLDFLWGRHNIETHSLGAALIAGLCVWPWRGARWALAVTASWASHVLFDWMGSDTTPPLGVMALWPVSSDYYFANVFWFEAISRRYWLPGFWQHNLTAVGLEVLYLGPPLMLIAFLRWRRSVR